MPAPATVRQACSETSLVTGRARVALFACRIPAALGLTWLVACAGYAIVLAGTYAFASGAAMPGAGLVLRGFGFSLLSTGVVSAVAVGLASLMTSRPAALTTFIAWQLVASPIIASISSLGSARRIVLSQAIAHFGPVHFGDARSVSMPAGTAVVVTALWLIVFISLGAWRTQTMDT